MFGDWDLWLQTLQSHTPHLIFLFGDGIFSGFSGTFCHYVSELYRIRSFAFLEELNMSILFILWFSAPSSRLILSRACHLLCTSPSSQAWVSKLMSRHPWTNDLCQWGEMLARDDWWLACFIVFFFKLSCWFLFTLKNQCLILDVD